MNYITLSEMEQEIARRLGEARSTANRTQGILDLKVGSNSGISYDVNGMAAEMAVARELNCYPDLSIEPRSGGHDLITGSDKKQIRIDVKHSVYDSAKLLITAKKHNDNVDIYVLVVGELPTLRIAGWIWAAEAMQPKYYNRFPQHGEGWHILQNELRQWGHK